jgi:uncharacterized membrane protein YeaQ/YmgE (transglycosylase-associated protein family)
MAAQPLPSTAVGRDVAVVIGSFLVLGVLTGVLWWWVVPPAQFTKLPRGGSMSEVELSKQFAADGFYVVIAAVVGVLAGLVLAWWRSRDLLLTSVLLVVGSALAAALMAVTGHLLGPGPTRAALAAAKVGAKVPERLDVDTVAVYLSWPVAVLLGASLVLFGRTVDSDA